MELNLISIDNLLMNFRFNAVGIFFTGFDNYISNIYFHQAKISEIILLEDYEQPYSESYFPEHQFTESEKCNLFFTISHFINNTALSDDDDSNDIYFDPITTTNNHNHIPMVKSVKGNLAASSRKDFLTEIPIKSTTQTTPRPKQTAEKSNRTVRRRSSNR